MDRLDRRDLDFMLFDLFGLGEVLARPRFADYDRGAADAVLDAAWRLAGERFAPFAAKLDACPPRLTGGRVETIPELKAALDAYAGAGFIALDFDAEVGGLQAPYMLALASQLIFTAADNAACGYAFLTSAAARLLAAFGSPELKARFLAPLLQGRFLATMCLSEPQAGSSLADIETLAEPCADGTYRLRGSKMWISGGDHELSETIVHFVLARTPGAPPGVRGLSLFLAPKHRLGPGGALAGANGVDLVGLNAKLGHRGTTNCALAFGADGECEAYLVGGLHQGLAHMFQMMNEARIGVGGGAAVTAYAAWRYALAYARERRQGRPFGVRDGPPVRLIDHPDVRRMLLAQKAIAEGGLALTLYCGRLVEDARGAPDPAVRAAAQARLDLITPIAKSWPAERGLKANSLAIQTLGGAGYVRDHPLERWYRDQRLNPIHEGATGIQALDLVGRKLGQDDGGAMAALIAEMRGVGAQAGAHPVLQPDAQAFMAAVDRLEDASACLRRARGSVAQAAALANATAFLELAGDVIVAWLWLRQGLIAVGRTEQPFFAGKLAACRYFHRYELPRTEVRAGLILELDDTCLSVSPDVLG